MGIRGELFTTRVQVENRTYFFNLKENRLGDVFLQIVESKNVDGAGFDRHAIVVFQDEMQLFLQGFNQSLDFIEKKHKEYLKEKRAKKQREHEAPQKDSNREMQKHDSLSDTPIRKVRIVKKDSEQL